MSMAFVCVILPKLVSGLVTCHCFKLLESLESSSRCYVTVTCYLRLLLCQDQLIVPGKTLHTCDITY